MVTSQAAVLTGAAACRRAVLMSRVVDASTLRKLNQQLGGQASAKPNLPESLWIPPNGATQLLGDAFQEAGCCVFYSFDDTDKEAAFWAKKNKAFAVITDDTDFLCYEGVDRIWSANIKLPSSELLKLHG
jgi:hypothetical protein